MKDDLIDRLCNSISKEFVSSDYDMKLLVKWRERMGDRNDKYLEKVGCASDILKDGKLTAYAYVERATNIVAWSIERFVEENMVYGEEANYNLLRMCADDIANGMDLNELVEESFS